MREVAEAAGVSRATASYALRGDPRIIPKTAEKVMRAARDLQYTTNLTAKSLRSGKSGIIGVAIFELDKPYPSEMSAAVSREAAKNGFQAIIQQTSNSKESEISILQKVTSQLCDGTIFSPGNVTSEEIKELAGGKPIVLLDSTSLSPLFDTVLTPSEDGAHDAIEHLLKIGCRNILILGADFGILQKPDQKMTVSARRLRGCKRAFDEVGMSFTHDNVVDTPDWGTETARRTIHNLVQSGRHFDGLFCMTDSMSLGAIRSLADSGIRVPDDVRVIGFDGINEGDFSVPSLSTIEVDLHDLAQKSIELLARRIDGDTTSIPQSVTAEYRLIERESTSMQR
ncbi:MAG: LacI family transcriptional regulator [Bifidobacteriaceae bacterium]|jgi:DNA-binding LacI/PurR family transcriptional regulator|nr:LacI family transcriptional regulator [Bifidobacteriaceae bacterium]